MTIEELNVRFEGNPCLRIPLAIAIATAIRMRRKRRRRWSSESSMASVSQVVVTISRLDVGLR
jgi:hypothetical protein